jgi:hypothetical protein
MQPEDDIIQQHTMTLTPARVSRHCCGMLLRVLFFGVTDLSHNHHSNILDPVLFPLRRSEQGRRICVQQQRVQKTVLNHTQILMVTQMV